MDHVEVGGLRVAYQRAGEGPALVLLHGGLGDSREWRRQLEGLADEFTVVAWDAPGCGGSSDPPSTFRLPDYADCLAGFIHVLDLGRPHVGGLSWGGGLALELYRRHSQVPRSLVLASAYASSPQDPVEIHMPSPWLHYNRTYVPNAAHPQSMFVPWLRAAHVCQRVVPITLGSAVANRITVAAGITATALRYLPLRGL